MENSNSGPSFSCCSLEICFDSKTVALAGQPVSVTPLEFNLLAYLAHHAERAVSTQELIEQVWRCEAGGTANQVKSCIKRLRKKLGENEQSPVALHTIHGWGYRLCSPDVLPPPPTESKLKPRSNKS